MIMMGKAIRQIWVNTLIARRGVPYRDVAPMLRSSLNNIGKPGKLVTCKPIAGAGLSLYRLLIIYR